MASSITTESATPIEDYAFIGDLHTGALVSRNGSVDWLCFPRFDSQSVFAALLGGDDAGSWQLAPMGEAISAEREYLPDTFVLRTVWTTSTGKAEVLEFMPVRDGRADLVRRVRGIEGTVRFSEQLRLRFDYGATLPWVRQAPEEGGHALIAVAGPDAVIHRGRRLTAKDHAHSTEFDVVEGETCDAVLTWYPSHKASPPAVEVDAALDRTIEWWREWASHSSPPSPYDSVVQRSLLILRALTNAETGGIVAAATMGLPEVAGGERNWDYRYTWLRDAALTIEVLLTHGYKSEAQEWRRWLLRAIAGDPADVQIMYGLAGERRLDEYELPHLEGYEGAAPVRVGNAAYLQRQWDIFGEVMVALHAARVMGVDESKFSWPLQRALLGFLEENWSKPDRGIWEIRGEEQHFTHSRVMVWAAFDRGVRAARDFGLDGPVERWEKLRDEVRAEILERGYDEQRETFVQYYGTTEVDAALLQLPAVGFVAHDDPRMLGTVAALERDLMSNGFLLRYRTSTGVDGLAGEEHPFLTCSFWLVEQYAGSGRLDDAKDLMERLIALTNDVGMLSEEYDPVTKRQMGNTPQALSHLALVRAADAIAAADGATGADSFVRGSDEPAEAQEAERSES